jgi:FkbH-like protein
MTTENAQHHLNWLLPAPKDFGMQIKALRAESGNVGPALKHLAEHALDGNQLQRLCKLFGDVRDRVNDFIPLKLGIVSNATTEFIVPAIIGTGLRHGLAIECVTTPFGQFLQSALDPLSEINQAQCDICLIALDFRALPLETGIGQDALADAAIKQSLTLINTIRKGLAPHCKTIVTQTLAPLPDSYSGSLDFVLAGALDHQVARFNIDMVSHSRNEDQIVFDVAGVAARIGLSQWHDPAIWNLAKQPFALSCVPLYAESLCRIIASVKGKARKALVLDLDNTVWAGVIGDDGMTGINIAQGDPTGEAHLALQRYALNLRERGIVLAVSSKNTDDVARQVFREHPDMLLREEHIAVFQANWTDKASNLRAIAKALNIGVDALVFVDDNPAERALVRKELPQVAVPELPDDPAFYVRTLAAGGYFEAVAYSHEDGERAKYYADNAKRAELQSAVTNIDEYLQSLNMEIEIRPFDEGGKARIAQLINKSNQFNLTTRRYSEADVAAMIDDPQLLTMQIRLADAFGDNGMIAVVIVKKSERDWEIDSWLMSCRVLGRRVEDVVLEQLCTLAQQQGAARLIGVFRPTDRNGIVKNHYLGLGFECDHKDRDGVEYWTLPVDQVSGRDTLAVYSEIRIRGYTMQEL